MFTLQLSKTISCVCSKNNGKGHVKKFLSNCRSASQVSYVVVRQSRDSYKWVSYKRRFGCRWVVVNGGGYILAGGGRWWAVVDGDGWLWMVVGGGIV